MSVVARARYVVPIRQVGDVLVLSNQQTPPPPLRASIVSRPPRGHLHPLSHRKKRSVCVLIPPTLSPSAHLRGSQPAVALDAASVKCLPAPPTKLPAVQGSALTPPSRPSCSAQSGLAAARVSLGWTGSSSSVRHLEKPPLPTPGPRAPGTKRTEHRHHHPPTNRRLRAHLFFFAIDPVVTTTTTTTATAPKQHQQHQNNSNNGKTTPRPPVADNTGRTDTSPPPGPRTPRLRPRRADRRRRHRRLRQDAQQAEHHCRRVGRAPLYVLTPPPLPIFPPSQC